MTDNIDRKPKFLLIGMPTSPTGWPLYALAHVCGIIRKADWECKVLDMNIRLFNLASEEDQANWTNRSLWIFDEKYALYVFQKYKSEIKNILQEFLSEDDYNIIGFSVHIQSKQFSIEGAKLINSLQPDIPILFGGPDCFPLEFGLNYLTGNRYKPNIILTGEAEIALVQFLKEFGKTGSIETTVPGFAFRRNGEIIDNGEPQLPNLRDENVIADHSQFDFSTYKASGLFWTFLSKGCINKCAFCNEHLNYKRFRVRKAEDVVKEIAYNIQHVKRSSNNASVSFADSIFNGHLKEMERLCDLILESGLKFYWKAPVSFRRIISREVLEKMYHSGCRSLMWGFESASQNVVDLMNKKVKMDTVEKVLADSIEVGIKNELAIITGFPGETAEDVITTLMFILEYKDNKCIIFPYAEAVFVQESSFLSRQHLDYGIIDTHRTHWYTENNRNNRDTRVIRAFILKNAISNTEIIYSGDTEHTVQEIASRKNKNVNYSGMIKAIDFNSLPVASEIAAILYAAGKRGNKIKEVLEVLQEWDGKNCHSLTHEELDFWRPENVPNDIPLDRWFQKDKNSDESKRRIIEILMDSVRSAKQLLLPES